ncbi:restriction endonuclease subunit S [Pantoea sp.]|uniref:restriction endonuclease subunit S n=1 Tax=Pantoea sp. TaxID=69393 RepID=UPI002901DD11|nr:restriction endonuclease subunit S [Pantoea sp.]MDU2728079.1 restriction endonuclease subunit S [Pantoea sp.]
MVPKLRFRNFTQDWHENSLGDLVDIKSGNSPSNYELSSVGEYPFIKVEDMNNCSKYQVRAREFVVNSQPCFPTGSVVFPKRGAAIMNNKVRILNQNSCADTNMMALVPINIHQEYLYYLISFVGLYKIADTSTIPQINNKHILPFNVIIPEKKEQTKVANFLSSVDEKITLLNNQYDLLCRYKKGMMQKILRQELRFKDENGDNFPEWNPCQLKDVATRVTRKNKENNQTILTISGRDGLVDQMSYFNKKIASKNVTGYYLINNGEFAYNKSYSQGYPMGAIKMLTNYDKGVVSTLYICLKLNDNQSNSFYQQYFESGIQNRSIEKVAQEGARNHGLLNIGVNDFFDIELQIPSLEEQTKIANFLSAIDDKITAKKVQLDKLKTWKQGLLQQMFV